MDDKYIPDEMGIRGEAAIEQIGGTRVFFQGYESPVERFLKGRGKVIREKDGKVFSIFEVAQKFKKNDYPLILDSQIYFKEDILRKVADLLLHGKIKNAKRKLGTKAFEHLMDRCKESVFTE